MPAPSRLDNLRALRIANLDMAFATAFGALVAGNFLAEFTRYLTADDRIRGWIGALPALIGILQIPGGVIGERYASYKRFVALGGLLWRLWWVPVIFLPIAPESWPRLEILIFCIAMQAASIHFVQPTYNEWLSVLVPQSHRGWYFSRRYALAVLVGAVIGFPASALMDWIRQHGDVEQGLSLIFGAGVVFGMASMIFYMRMPETRREEIRRRSFIETIRGFGEPMREKAFRRLLLFLVVFVIGQLLAGPFFFYYGREVLGLSFIDLQVFAAFTAVSSLLSAGMWGYLSDKYGNKPVLFLAGILLSLGPLAWVFAQPGRPVWNYVVLILGHIAAGFAWTGVGVGQFNFILAVAPNAIRGPAIGLAQAVMAVVSGLAPLGAGVLLHFLRSVVGESSAYEWLFSINAAIRVVSVFLLFGIIDKSSRGVREFLGQIAGVRPKGVIAMRRLGQSGGTEERQHAIRKVAESGMRMAETEIARLLYDPSPRVRREAAVALRQIGGRESVRALIRLVEKHPPFVEDEMIETISAIGDETAVPALVSLLENPSSSVRRATARALGRLGSSRALGPLIQAASHPNDPELRRAAIQAIRTIGDPGCETVVVKALRDENPSVRVAAAEACADFEFESAGDALRELLRGEVDETFAEVAYALARIGDLKKDSDLILSAASRMDSAVGRRRALLGAAKLLGVEDDLYRIFMMDAIRRDQFMLDLVRNHYVKGLRQALALYHSGKEKEAIVLLAESSGIPELERLAAHAPKDGFLLAAAIVAGR